MIITRSQIVPNHPTILDEEETFDKSFFKDSYPISDIKKCHLEGQLNRTGDIVTAHLHIEAVATLLDSYTNKPFDQKVIVDEAADLLLEENDQGEGYIVPGGQIDLSEIALRMIRSSLPIKILKPGSRLPKSGEGYSVLSEEEVLKQKHESYNPAFDALKDLDIKNKK
jgi:hypothetical protein